MRRRRRESQIVNDFIKKNQLCISTLRGKSRKIEFREKRRIIERPIFSTEFTGKVAMECFRFWRVMRRLGIKEKRT